MEFVITPIERKLPPQGRPVKERFRSSDILKKRIYFAVVVERQSDGFPFDRTLVHPPSERDRWILPRNPVILEPALFLVLQLGELGIRQTIPNDICRRPDLDEVMREGARLLDLCEPIQEHFIGQGQVLPNSLAKRNAHRDFRIEIMPLVTADLVAPDSPSPSPQLASQQEQGESKRIHLGIIKLRVYSDEPSKADNLTDVPVFDLAKP